MTCCWNKAGSADVHIAFCFAFNSKFSNATANSPVRGDDAEHSCGTAASEIQGAAVQLSLCEVEGIPQHLHTTTGQTDCLQLNAHVGQRTSQNRTTFTAGRDSKISMTTCWRTREQ